MISSKSIFCAISLATLLMFINPSHSALVDGGAYRIENVQSGLYMATQPSLGGNERLAYVMTDPWVFSKEQNWGVEFYSNGRTITPASIRENNVTLEQSPNSSFLTSVLYDIMSVSSIEYRIKHKKKQLCLVDINKVVSLGECEGPASTWKFYRNG